MFWIIAGEGIARLMPICVIIFSGMLLPLPLCPEWAQPILEWLPFRGLIFFILTLQFWRISIRHYRSTGS